MYKNKPIIGVTIKHNVEDESYWTRPNDLLPFAHLGAVVVPIPIIDDIEQLDCFLDICDGFFVSGGQDINPELYGEDNTYSKGPFSNLRDKTDAYIIKGAFERDKPLLGICRGMQMINAALGGTIYQDLNLEKITEHNHSMQKPWDRFDHKVTLLEGTPIEKELGLQSLDVNSIHHQAVKEPAPDLKVMAVSDDGVIEALYAPKKSFVWAVQWHPEMLWQKDKTSLEILGAFVKKCAEIGKKH